MAKSKRYEIMLKGEVGIYPIKGWESLTIEGAALAISDVIGFKADFVEEKLKKALARRDNAEFGDQWGDVPRWLIGPSKVPEP